MPSVGVARRPSASRAKIHDLLGTSRRCKRGKQYGVERKSVAFAALQDAQLTVEKSVQSSVAGWQYRRSRVVMSRSAGLRHLHVGFFVYQTIFLLCLQKFSVFYIEFRFNSFVSRKRPKSWFSY